MRDIIPSGHTPGRAVARGRRATLHILEQPNGIKLQLEFVPPLDRSERPVPEYAAMATGLSNIAGGDADSVAQLVLILQRFQQQMEPAARVELWSKLQEGYCCRCGQPAPCECRGGIVPATEMPQP